MEATMTSKDLAADPVPGNEQELDSVQAAVETLGHPLDDAPDVDDDLTVSKQDWFIRLVQRWQKHHRMSLQLRYDTGKSINEKIGPPTSKQPRGYGVVATLSAQIGVDRGEISRMRWFAHRVQSLKEFCREHPDIATWDSVKTWLADQKRKERGEQQESDEEIAPVDRFADALKDLVLPSAANVEEEEKEDLMYTLRKFGRRFKKHGVSITVAELERSDS
jgi:hypothetical protein